MLLCTRCGSSFQDNNRFCINCGAALTSGASTPQEVTDSDSMADPGGKWLRAINLKETGQLREASIILKELISDHAIPDLILVSASQLVSILPKLTSEPVVPGSQVFADIQKYAQLTVNAYEQSRPESQKDFQSLGGIEDYRELLQRMSQTEEAYNSCSSTFRRDYEDLITSYPGQILEINSEGDVSKLDIDNVESQETLRVDELLTPMRRALSVGRQVVFLAYSDSVNMLFVSKRGKRIIRSS